MAQNLAVCQFCEVSNNIKWKCINCDLILCEECNTKIHTKIRTSDKHTVVDLKEINNRSVSETIRTSELHNIPCSYHEEERCIIYCTDCNKLLCSTCLIDSHTNHKLSQLSTVYQERIQELKDEKQKLDDIFSMFFEHEKGLVKVKVEKHDKYNQTKQQILDREKDIKETVTKQTLNLIHQLDSIWKPQEKVHDKQLAENRKHKDEITKQKSQIEEAFLSHNPASVFGTWDTIHQDFCNKSPAGMPIWKDIILLQPNITEQNINWGLILTIPRLQIVKTYSSELPNIFKTESFKDGRIITNTSNKITIHSNQLTEKKLISKTIAQNFDVIDMTLNEDEHLLFSSFKSGEVTVLCNFETNSKPNIFLSISPLHVRGIHATNKNIYIGFKDNGQFFPLTKESRRGIMVLDYDHRHMRTIEFDTNNDRIFSLPDSITTNNNGEICVVDCTCHDTWEGRVVMLTELGKVKWIYQGHPTINSTTKLTPFDIVSSEKFLFVTDLDSNAVHVLSMGGDLVTSLTGKDGMEKPFSIDIDKSGRLLIGSASIETNHNNAKLYMVKLTD